ncbi:hypothetical protein ACFPM3_19795 [Streptomyces coeruleoprunus]|uniref:Tetratricopeptide repeat protein n=1 Tax=Streptomyces coeruleoprunus TaxID=285563 RepID=A0ABV9XIW4_9ACTN
MDPSWWIPTFLYVVLGSAAVLFFAATAISRWASRLLLAVTLVVWALIAGQVSEASGGRPGGATVDVSAVDGVAVTVGCLVDHGVLCLGPRDELGFPFSPGFVTWILLGSLLVGFVRLLELRNARGEPVSIEVDDLSYANPGSATDSPGTAGRDAATCTARMRTILSTQVQTPPPLPGGEPTLSLPTVLYEAKPKDADVVTKLLAYGWQLAFPRRGWRLTGHVQRSDGGFGVTVNITEKSRARSVLQDTYWADSEEEAVYKAAYTVAQLAIENSVGIPRWTKWHAKNGRGLRHYRDGADLLRNGGKPRKAERQFASAVRLDPANGLARSELALLRERRSPEEYLIALEMYLGLAQEYPEMIQPRYRAGVVLDLVDEWLDVWMNEPTWRNRLQKALAGARLVPASEAPPPPERRPARYYFLRLSGVELTGLSEDLRYRRLLRAWSRREGRDLYREMIRPLGTLRPRSRAAVEAAILSQRLHVLLSSWDSLPTLPELRRADPGFERDELRLRNLSGHANGLRSLVRAASGTGSPRLTTGGGEALGRIQIAGLARYNAACFYARLIGPGDGTDWADRTEEAARLSLDHLAASVQESELLDNWLDHLSDDPDLGHLQRHPVFRDWTLTRHTVVPPGTDEDEDADKDKALDAAAPAAHEE